MPVTPLPASIDGTIALLAKADYIADRSLATVLYLVTLPARRARAATASASA